jgi:hypothetical protein
VVTRTRTARARREQELQLLAQEGVPLRALIKSGHWIIGPLHIYTASGRWFNEETEQRGRLGTEPIRHLLEKECSLLVPSKKPALEETACSQPQEEHRGQQLCPEIAEKTQQMNLLYEKYEQFMTLSAKHNEQYQRFMEAIRERRRLA